MMESIYFRFYALYFIPKINAYDWTFPLLPRLLEFDFKVQNIQWKNADLHPHLTACKGKTLINQAVRVKIDHLENNV